MLKLYLLFLPLIMLAGCSGVVVNTHSNSGNQANEANAKASTPTSASAQTVTIDSPDGVKLVGSFYPAAQPNSPALLLLHQWQSDRHSYDDFAKQMQAKGFAVLSIDGRGFGESVKTADGKTVTAGRTDADVKAMLDDVGAAYDFLSKQPNVDPNRVGIVGASYGSSLALIYAADHPNVAAVALLSPGLNYFGSMQTEPAVKKYGDRPLYLIASFDDKESFEAVERLNPIVGERAKYGQTIHPEKEAGHGTSLLKVGGVEELIDFFSKTIGSGK